MSKNITEKINFRGHLSTFGSKNKPERPIVGGGQPGNTICTLSREMYSSDKSC